MRGTAELETMIGELLKDYLSRNRAAYILQEALNEAGVGLFPLLDHLTIRTLNIDQRSEPFLQRGYGYSETLNYDNWFAKVYRAEGYPALFIDQAYEDEQGNTSLLPGWVKTFGDHTLHHVAVRVENIEQAIQQLEGKNVYFAGRIVGERGGDLRQIFTCPEQVDGQAFSVLELTERRRGFQGFSPPQADSLMQSTLTTG